MNKNTESNLWGIHSGKNGDAETLFLKKKCVAVGWTKMGDLASLKPDRDAFKRVWLMSILRKIPVRSQTMEDNCSDLFTK